MARVRHSVQAIIIFLILFFALTDFSFCDDSGIQKQGYSRDFGIFSGFGSGKLKRQDDYEVMPLYFQFGFDIKPFFEKINISPKGNIRFILEPFLNTVAGPDANVETGLNFVLKYSHPITQRFHLYFEGGLGILYTSQHTYEQGTQFNFNEQVGGGLSFLFCKNKSVSLGYRYRHFSNADMKAPNSGVDIDFYLLGFTVSY